MESEHFPGIVVDPVRGLPELFPGDPLKVCPFRVASAGHAILFLVGAPLAGAVRMAIIKRRPLFSASETGPLQALDVCKLGAIVNGDRTEYDRERGPEFPLQGIQGGDHGRCLPVLDL